MDAWLILGGRLHPLLLHLPIGILFLLVAFELWNLSIGWKTPRETKASFRLLILSCLAGTAVFSALSGWLLATEGGYGKELLLLHRITGTAAGALAIALFFLRHRGAWYAPLLVITVAVMIVTSHYGGSLTHGKDFLTGAYLAAIAGKGDEAPATEEEPVPSRTPADFVIYPTLIQPILDATCVSCHGEEKQKGELRLDTFEYTMAGSDFGPVVVPGSIEDSELTYVLRLPIDDDEHMPPEGKPQPTMDEIRLLEWWVQTGASATANLADIEPPTELRSKVFTDLGLMLPE